ncbi:MAG: methyltransferase domain-containing protein [Betaproteobacteria bacterium]
MSWDPGQYLTYANERLRPALDLIARIPLAAPKTVIDLGCGAGNVAQVLAARWRDAAIVGVDSSAAMLSTARAATQGDARYSWLEADLGAWTPDSPPDLVFSNAALHWLDGHATLFPRLLAAVAPGGALAVQMPDNFAAPSHAALFDLARDAHWRDRLGAHVRPQPVAAAIDYARWLGSATSVDVWTTEYLQLLPAAGAGEHPVVAWMKGAALTPFLGALDDGAQRRFVAEYRERIAAAYPALDDGRVPFPFRRRFIVALR